VLTPAARQGRETMQVHAPVQNLVLYLTDDCNLRCSYCFVPEGTRRMSADIARKAVDFFLTRHVSGTCQRLEITFFGGEPFLEPERMREVMEYARAARPNVHKWVTFSATTNGTFATPEVERLVKEFRMNLLVSLDGSEAASVCRRFASGAPSWPVVAGNLPKLARWSREALVRMTFHPGALKLRENVQVALDLGAHGVALCPVAEAPWQDHLGDLGDAFDELGSRFIDEARAGRLYPLEITCLLLRELHEARMRGGRPRRPCAVGSLLLAVDPEGNVMPCHRFIGRPGEWLGSVGEARLSADRMEYVTLSPEDFQVCRDCEAAPVCGGGCRVVALNAGKGLRGAHPGHCAVTRAHARAVRRIYQTLEPERNPVLAGILGGQRPRVLSPSEFLC